MKKYILPLLLIGVLVGCRVYPSEYEKVIVWKTPFDYDGKNIPDGWWKYGYVIDGNTATFYDTINAYNVGDTIHFQNK